VIFQPSINLVLGDRNQCDLSDKAHGPFLHSFLHIEPQMLLGRALQGSKESVMPSQKLQSQAIPCLLILTKGILSPIFILFTHDSSI